MADFLSPLLLKDGVCPDIPPLGQLAEVDDDDPNASIHRSTNIKGFRRHRHAKGQNDHSGGKSGRKQYNHTPHEIFVELDVLRAYGEEQVWKEIARFIKYEEDVEEGSDRFGKAHVASLSFFSLINLRRLIESGVILTDVEERDICGVIYQIVDQMLFRKLILAEDKATLIRILLLKHRHVEEREGIWSRFAGSGSLTTLLPIVEETNRLKEELRAQESLDVGAAPLPRQKPKLIRRNSALSRLMSDTTVFSRATTQANGQQPSLANLSEEDLNWISNKEKFLKRVPVGSEGCLVMVGKEESLRSPVMGFCRLAEATLFPNITEIPIKVRFVIVVIGPSSNAEIDYLEIGRSISTLMSKPHFSEVAYRAEDKKDLIKGIHSFLDESVIVPPVPAEWDEDAFPHEQLKERHQSIKRRKEQRRRSLAITTDAEAKPLLPAEYDPLKRTGRLFGGLINEIKKRYPLYLSDITDGLNSQCAATAIFIYFASVTGTIAFGGILASKTDDSIGISESLIAASAAGVLFSLLAGQPLIIVGPTGPLLLLDESLYLFCLSRGVDFLAARVWIGIWIGVIGLFIVCFEGSCIVKFFTRFTQEVFSFYSSILFIVESATNLAKVYIHHPVQHFYGWCHKDEVILGDSSPKPNTALLSTVLYLGTFLIAYACRLFRGSKYLFAGARTYIGNFAVPLSICAMVTLDYSLKDHAETAKLSVPGGLDTTKPRDSWLIDPTQVKTWVPIASILPAALLFIVIFMEMSICQLMVGKKEQKLKKGGGFHLDILIMCLINSVSGLFGGAWICGATVRALTHTSALAVFSTNNPPGEKPVQLGVREQRISNLISSAFVGLSALMSPILVLIPIPVLYGVFLYMGVSSMTIIQFFDRVKLLFVPVENHPQVPYVRKVRTKKLHLFTIIQIICLVTVCIVQYSPAALGFPVLILMLIPFRYKVLPLLFDANELAALDGKDSGSPMESDTNGLVEPLQTVQATKQA